MTADPTRPPEVATFIGSPAAAAAELAGEIADLIRSRAPGERPPVLGLATGRSPVGLYAELVRLHRAGDLDFSRVVTFNLDEYLGLPVGHPCTFRSFMEEHLFAHVNLVPRNIHFLGSAVAERETLAHCLAYEESITAAGGIDLQVLGVGRNGHVAFNEPGTAPESRTRAVWLAEGTRADAAADFASHGEVPSRALTVGIATLREARALRILAFGGAKAEAVRALRWAPTSPELPVTWLRGHCHLRLLADAAACPR